MARKGKQTNKQKNIECEVLKEIKQEAVELENNRRELLSQLEKAVQRGVLQGDIPVNVQRKLTPKAELTLWWWDVVQGCRGGQVPDLQGLSGQGKEDEFYLEFRRKPLKSFKLENDMILHLCKNDHALLLCGGQFKEERWSASVRNCCRVADGGLGQGAEGGGRGLIL